MINQIGPGDEGECKCEAFNKYGSGMLHYDKNDYFPKILKKICFRIILFSTFEIVHKNIFFFQFFSPLSISILLILIPFKTFDST